VSKLYDTHIQMERGVKVGGYVLHARALAGVNSCCYVESVDVAFDIGCCFGRVVNKSHVFITHGHIDHIAALAAHAGRRALQKNAPAKYYAPAHLVPHMQTIMESFSAMTEVHTVLETPVPRS
jgi:ribonuclease Z